MNRTKLAAGNKRVIVKIVPHTEATRKSGIVIPELDSGYLRANVVANSEGGRNFGSQDVVHFHRNNGIDFNYQGQSLTAVHEDDIFAIELG